MAAIFKMEDSIPMWGDAEAQWLVDNLGIEFSDDNENNVMLRVSKKDIKRMWEENSDAEEWRKPHVGILNRIEQMIDQAGTEYIDLLVRW